MTSSPRPSQPPEILHDVRPKKRYITRTIPTITGALLPSGAILWAHAENITTNEQAYLVQPPTVSRALTNPLVEKPFASTMIIAAILLTISVTQIVTAFVKLIRSYSEAQTKTNWTIIACCIACEGPAILGMIVLSQDTGDANRVMHDLGSYMLFFGHTIAIIACGFLIRNLCEIPSAQSDPRILALKHLPKHAAWAAFFSATFGLAYAFTKVFPEDFVFTQHLILSIVEIIALLALLSFLGRLWKFLLASAKSSARNYADSAAGV